MANRHKMARKSGGKVYYDGGSSKVAKEASERKDGGSVKRAEGGKVPAKAAGGRLDKRARGGRTGADKSPFSSAALKKG